MTFIILQCLKVNKVFLHVKIFYQKHKNLSDPRLLNGSVKRDFFFLVSVNHIIKIFI